MCLCAYVLMSEENNLYTSISKKITYVLLSKLQKTQSVII